MLLYLTCLYSLLLFKLNIPLYSLWDSKNLTPVVPILTWKKVRHTPQTEEFGWNIWFYKVLGGFHLKSAGFHECELLRDDQV